MKRDGYAQMCNVARAANPARTHARVWEGHERAQQRQAGRLGQPADVVYRRAAGRARLLRAGVGRQSVRWCGRDRHGAGARRHAAERDGMAVRVVAGHARAGAARSRRRQVLVDVCVVFVEAAHQLAGAVLELRIDACVRMCACMHLGVCACGVCMHALGCVHGCMHTVWCMCMRSLLACAWARARGCMHVHVDVSVDVWLSW
eukprot:153627-Chlamydomonas_euryale.AAC.1